MNLAWRSIGTLRAGYAIDFPSTICFYQQKSHPPKRMTFKTNIINNPELFGYKSQVTKILGIKHFLGDGLQLLGRYRLNFCKDFRQ